MAKPNKFGIALLPRHLCAACDHRNRMGGCYCDAKGCACRQWRLFSHARNVPGVFG